MNLCNFPCRTCKLYLILAILSIKLMLARYRSSRYTKTMKTAKRLYEQIKPSRYQLEITPDLKAFSFEATETIEFELENPSKKLIFNAVDLEINEAIVEENSGNITYQPTEQTVTLEFDTELAGSASLKLTYSGKLRDDMHGFYRSRYTDQTGEKQWLATTQFEATSAREAFI